MTSLTAFTRVLALCLVSISSFGCALRGSGTSAIEGRELESFDRIDVSGALDLVVHVEPGVAHKLEVTADDNIVGKVITTVSNGELDIAFDNTISVRPKTPIRVEIWVPALLAIDASGASDIIVGGLHGESFELEISGAGSSVLRGAVDQLDIEVSGAAHVNAKDLQAKDVSVEISGAAQTSVWASDSLDVEISGAGKVSYWGSPATINKQISGAGRLEPGT